MKWKWHLPAYYFVGLLVLYFITSFIFRDFDLVFHIILLYLLPIYLVYKLILPEIRKEIETRKKVIIGSYMFIAFAGTIIFYTLILKVWG